MKVHKCSCCGANLKLEHGQRNVVCEYCNAFVSVEDGDDPQYAVTAILGHIAEMGARKQTDEFSGAYKQIKDLIAKHNYIQANERLDQILARDERQARAWFYKSLLPIIEQEVIVFKGYQIDIIRVAQISNRKQLHAYLKYCGLSLRHQKSFLDYYRRTDFLYEQNMKYLDNAIRCAASKEREVFLGEQKRDRIAAQRRKRRRERWGTVGLVLLLCAVLVGGAIAFWYFARGVLNG